jgi:hypothetical protein
MAPREHTHTLLVSDEVALNELAIEKDLAGSLLKEAGDHLHGGRLARAVRPKIAGHFAPACREAYVVHRG